MEERLGHDVQREQTFNRRTTSSIEKGGFSWYIAETLEWAEALVWALLDTVKILEEAVLAVALGTFLFVKLLLAFGRRTKTHYLLRDYLILLASCFTAIVDDGKKP